MDGRDPTPGSLTTPRTVRSRSMLRAVVNGAVVGLLFAAAIETYSITAGGHVHEVVPGIAYRSSQPSPEDLDYLVRKHGIRTVINLRGCCDPAPWYLAQSRAAARLDLSQEDLPFSAGRLPSVPVIRHLVEVLDRSEKPVLIHCFQGVDRTGMASAMAQLLYSDATLDEALEQLSLRYGHLSFGRTGNIDRFFELYREWLVANGRAHSRAHFRHWVTCEYCPGECLASLEVLEPKGESLVMQRGEPLAVRVRCTNQSVKPWRLRPGTNAGIHLFWELLTADDRPSIEAPEGRSGLFHAEVPPGGHIDLTLAVPPIRTPGRYRLRIDMFDEQHARFHQLGREPLVVEVEVR